MNNIFKSKAIELGRKMLIGEDKKMIGLFFLNDSKQQQVNISENMSKLMKEVNNSLLSKLAGEEKWLNYYQEKNEKDPKDALILDSINKIKKRISNLKESLQISIELSGDQILVNKDNFKSIKNIPLFITYIKGEKTPSSGSITSKELVNILTSETYDSNTHMYDESLLYLNKLKTEDWSKLTKINWAITNPVLSIMMLILTLDSLESIDVPKRILDNVKRSYSWNNGWSAIDIKKPVNKTPELQRIEDHFYYFKEKLLDKTSREDFNSRSNYKIEKLGKTIKALFPETSPTGIEQLLNEVKEITSEEGDELDSIMSIVSGGNIPYFYNVRNNMYVENLPALSKTSIIGNGSSKGGSLMTSCMKGVGTYPRIQMYAQNPDKIKMLVLKSKSPNKILARAILWLPEDGNTYVDRIYSISDTCTRIVKSYMKKKGFIGIHNSSHIGTKSPSSFILKDIKYDNFYKYDVPYLDSLSKGAAYLKKDGTIYLMLSYAPEISTIQNIIKKDTKDENIKYISPLISSSTNYIFRGLNDNRKRKLIDYHRFKEKATVYTNNSSKNKDIIYRTIDNEIFNKFSSQLNINARTRYSIGTKNQAVLSNDFRNAASKYLTYLLRTGKFRPSKYRATHATDIIYSFSIEDILEHSSSNLCFVRIKRPKTIKNFIFSNERLLNKFIFNVDVNFVIVHNPISNIDGAGRLIKIKNNTYDYMLLNKSSVHKLIGSKNLKKVSNRGYEIKTIR